MAYKFNPFTGKLDQVGAGGGGGGTPGGSPTQVQFNDGGTFGGDDGLTFNKTTNALTVGASTVDGGSAKIYGDIDLDDGGSFSTTVQAVTPTANRTISFPDATGTVALVSGANGTIQYNDAGTLKGNSDFTVNVDWDNPTTTFTALKVNVPDVLQGNSDSKLLDLQVGGSSKFNVTTAGQLKTTSGQGDIETGLSPAASDFRVNVNGIYVVKYGNIYLANNLSNGYRQWLFQPGTGFILNSSAYFGWSDQNFSVHASNYDITLYRDAAGILAQRNGTNAQTFRLYNTLTGSDVSATGNYERGFLQWNSNVFEIGTEAGSGGGSEQPVRITAATLKLPNLPTYADNAAASAVLAVGDVYKTATGELRIVV